MRSKVPDMAPKVDVLLGNLEDGVPADRQGSGPRRPDRGRRQDGNDFGDTQFWTRVNSLDSPWGLDDLVEPPCPRSATSSTSS